LRLDATLKNVAKGTGIGKAKDETTLQSKINKRNGLCPNTYLRSTLLGTFKEDVVLNPSSFRLSAQKIAWGVGG
jgi:hypothetical protein